MDGGGIETLKQQIIINSEGNQDFRRGNSKDN